MVQIPSWLHSTFIELSNEYSHAQIRVKMKKLWPRQVGEEKQAVAVQKISRDQEFVLPPENLVATRKLGRDLKKIVATSLLFCDQKHWRNLKKGRKLIF